MALKAHLIFCDPLIVVLSNNLKSKNITSAYLAATSQENEAKWHMSFPTFCFQIKIMPRRRHQRCRLILLKRQILILLVWPHTSSVNRTPMLFCTGWAYNILTKRKFVGISMLLHPIKRKFAKGHFKGPKRSYVQFFIKVVSTWSICIAKKRGYYGHKKYTRI